MQDRNNWQSRAITIWYTLPFKQVSLSFLYVTKPKNYVSGTSIDLVMLTLSWSWIAYLKPILHPRGTMSQNERIDIESWFYFFLDMTYNVICWLCNFSAAYFPYIKMETIILTTLYGSIYLDFGLSSQCTYNNILTTIIHYKQQHGMW